MNIFQVKDIVIYALILIEAKIILEPCDKLIQGVNFVVSYIVYNMNFPFFVLYLFILIFVGFVIFLNYLLRKQKGRVSHGILYIMTAIFVVVKGIQYHVSIPLVSLVSIGFFLAFIAELSVALDARYGWVKTFKLKKSGFISDNTQEDEENVGWDNYADKLAERLVNTDVSNASFATALIGKWGTGKTTFLKLLRKDLMKHDVVVVDFNPWMSDSSKMIINDFFNNLKDALSEKKIALDGIIDKYVRLLVDWQEPGMMTIIEKFMNIDNKQGLQSVRDQISEKLSLLDKPIFVFIDDTDRLQKEEILEVMKLIRNTANFCNVIYVVTFDKQYVVDSLEKAGITESSLYLKKIFQLELKFPMFEGYLFTHFLLKELDGFHQLQDVSLRSNLANIEMQVTESGVTIMDYFDNFRDVKRFANEFLLTLDYIEGQGLVRDFCMHDLFLIELLGYADESIYNLLRTNPLEILSDENKTNFILRDNVKANSQIGKNTYNILHALFSQKKILLKNVAFVKLRRKTKLFTYFSLRPFAYQMGISEFQNILKFSSQEEVREVIVESNKGIFNKANHLYELLLVTAIRILDTKSLDNYFVILEEWTKLNLNFDQNKIVTLYYTVLFSKLKKSDSYKVADNALKRIFDYLMKDMNIGCYLLQRILVSMLNGKYFKNNARISCKISSYKKLIYDSRRSARVFLKQIRPSIYDIYEDSRLHEFISSSIIYSLSSEPGTPLMSSIEDVLIEYFSKSKRRNDYHEFFYRFHYPSLEYGDIIDETLGTYELDKDIKKYFVSLNFYIRFMHECFVYEQSDILKDYLEKNKILKGYE